MRFLRRDAELQELADELGQAGLLGADTEAAGYHRYHDRICLLQLSTRSATYIVDPLEIRELAPLAPVLGAEGVETIFHDADYDLRLLHRDYGITVAGLFDTKVAAQFTGEPGIGLATLLEKHLNVSLEKKYQRADWAQRPLPEAMVAYAAEDTRHLPELRDLLRDRLESLGRTAWAEEEFRLLEGTRWTEQPDEESYLRLKNTRDLEPRQLAALKGLYEWREAVAEARDVAPFRVLSNDALVETARRLPDSQGGLRAVPGIGGGNASRYGDALLEAVERARSMPDSELPRRPRYPRRAPFDPELEARIDRLKEVRDEAARRLDLDRGFLMPRDQLKTIAEARPASLEALAEVAGVRRWQVEALGEDLIDVLRAG